MDSKRGKSKFSMGSYLLKGLIALIILGGGYYVYIGNMKSSNLKKEQEQELQTPPDIGWVNGILYSEDNPSVVLDKDIVYEGQAVHGVKVLKVYKDRVEFEKDGKRWEQKLKEEPNMYWIVTPESDDE
jgi:hypothetical protein